MHTYPNTPRTSVRPLVYTLDQLTSSEPHMIVRARFVTPPYLGGESHEVDVMLSRKAYNRLTRAAAA